MANVKISALSELTSPVGSDVIPITDVSGTPTTKKVTVTNLMGASPVQSVAGRTGAVTIANTDVSGLGTASTLNVGTADTNIVQLADVSGTVKLPAVDGSQLTNISVDLDDNLRGTDNPHMGAFPNQSFKVIDNPDQSVMVVADENSLKFLLGSNANVFVVKGTGTATRLAEASELPAFTTTKDATEPDIELTDSDGEVYSVVNGDSDSIGGNGLPIRQGYQVPNMGGNPSPLLISGGSIA